MTAILSAKRAVVLVHGAWYGGWCWRDVAQRLHVLGHHRVFTPCLTGLGSRSHLLDRNTTLNTHISDVCNLIETEELRDITLVGHSYGGMVVTAVADRLASRISNLFFLDAYTPDSGQSALTIRSATTAASDQVVQLAIPAEGEGGTIPPTSAEHHGLRGPILDWANRHLRPMPLKCFQQPVQLDGRWLDVPNKVYLRASGFPAFYFDRYHDKWSNSSDWTAMKFDVPHNHMMMDPDWFVNILTKTRCLE
ncbi:esterase [Salpingoeca rosetta]|uniref:Esterase n=1 Tax=Salpingoeca rosetta (strain ATCC 50818 / BSB-021) TaxID=946362 RepID=F2U0Z7_SALR5|nr:esterase [Salpingoeca rosetta]EGD80571.1 esterase [Salpingoeca rosetta]|eukprot:XP_004997132.1 esterase [Salpingoeca rosetta]